MSRRIAFITSVVFALGVHAAWAAPVDPQIPFSTKVNVKVKRAYWFKWAFFQTADPADTADVWSEQMDFAAPKLRMRNRQLNHKLGSINPLNSSDFSQQMWVEVFRYKPVTSEWVSCSPRVRLNASAYAVLSNSVKPGSITSLELQNGAVTATKIGNGAVTAAKIGNGAVTDAKISGTINEAKIDPAIARDSEVAAAGIPSGFSITGETATPPPGYSYTGRYVLSRGQDAWAAKADLPTERQGLASAAVNGKIYAIGGTNGTSVATNEEYDPVANTWAAKADMPTARDGLVAAVVNGRIYAIGGYNGASLLTNEEYDPVANTWAAKADMPTARYGLASAAVNGKIYAIGGVFVIGSIPDLLLNNNEEYDPVANTWAEKNAMSTLRGGLAAAAVNGKVYAIGGYNGASLSTNEEYDPAINLWTTKADMPTARHGLAAAAVNGRINVFGGSIGTYSSKNEEYDPDTNSWATKADMPTARQYLAAAAVNGRIYTIGGYAGTVSAKNEEYDPNTKLHYFHQKD